MLVDDVSEEVVLEMARGAMARAAGRSMHGEGWDSVARRYEALIREVMEERGE